MKFLRNCGAKNSDFKYECEIEFSLCRYLDLQVFICHWDVFRIGKHT